MCDRVIDTVIDLVRTIDVEVAAFGYLIGTFAGNAGLTLDDEQAPSPMMAGRQTMLRRGRARAGGKRQAASYQG